jgi:hypothetical protein
VPEDWQANPAKLRQKDRDARWTVKTTKAKPRDGEPPMVDLTIPEFGYQNHISADRRHRLIRRWLVTDAAAHAGARLADLLDPDNTASGVWADTGYRSRKNEDLLRQRMLVSHVHRKKPAGRPMPDRTARANANKSAVRAHIEHVFADQKHRMGYSCAPSVSPARRPRSVLPTWSPTCAACSGWSASRRSPDRRRSSRTLATVPANATERRSTIPHSSQRAATPAHRKGGKWRCPAPS